MAVHKACFPARLVRGAPSDHRDRVNTACQGKAADGATSLRYGLRETQKPSI